MKVTYEILRKRIREEQLPTVAAPQTIIGSLAAAKKGTSCAPGYRYQFLPDRQVMMDPTPF